MGEAILSVHAKAANTQGRTRGRLEVTTGCIYTINDYDNRIACMDRDNAQTTPVERDANAAHLAACWNAVEAHCGGNPEAVGQLVVDLADARAELAYLYSKEMVKDLKLAESLLDGTVEAHPGPARLVLRRMLESAGVKI